MASKTMFAKSIIESDIFLEMKPTSQMLYIHLSANADDDGFVGNPKSIIRLCNTSSKELQELLDKRYILGFPSGVVVIKHWKINNNIRSDRHHPTTYQKELATLGQDEWGAYTELEKPLPTLVHTNGIPSDNQMDTESSIELDKVSIVKESNRHPTLEQIQEYIQENGYKVNAQRFLDYYTSNGWKVGRNPMKDWKATIRSWNSREKNNGKVETSYDINQVKAQAQQPIVYKKKTL